MLRSLLPSCLAATALLAAPTARADVGDDQGNYDPGLAQRRSGFAMGLSISAMTGTVSGYPNEIAKIDDPAYHATTGVGGGTGGSFWLGGALRDWFVIGAGATFGTLSGSRSRLSRGGAFVLHIEAFPLFYQAEKLRDLALVAEFGTGNRDIWTASTKQAEGGAMSYASIGVLYEPIRMGKHFSAGPIVQVGYQFSQNLNATLATAGFQISYYGGPG